MDDRTDIKPDSPQSSTSKCNSGAPLFKGAPVVYHGGRFDVRIVDVRGNRGATLQRDVVVHPGAVIILPLYDAEHIVMIQNERYAIGKTLWELPAGTCEPGEDPLLTASRELIEETGYSAAQIVPTGSFYTSPGFCNELMNSYVAKDLTLIGQSLDENEHITVKIVPLKEVLEMIRTGVIVDGKTIAAILFYNSFLK